MTRGRAIKEFCFECVGDSNKEVTLCCVFDCQLWPFRTGDNTTSKRYRERIKTAVKNYPQEFEELHKMGVTPETYLVSGRRSAPTRRTAKKSASPRS